MRCNPTPPSRGQLTASCRACRTLPVMQVTHAIAEDARAVAEIHVNVWRTAYASIVPADYLVSLSIQRREAMWNEYIATKGHELLVSKEAGVMQGWISFGQCRDEGSSKVEAEIWAIYVSPSAWSTGVGRLLWLRARALMLAQGFQSCSLWVFPQNERAIRFYRSTVLPGLPMTGQHQRVWSLAASNFKRCGLSRNLTANLPLSGPTFGDPLNSHVDLAH